MDKIIPAARDVMFSSYHTVLGNVKDDDVEINLSSAFNNLSRDEGAVADMFQFDKWKIEE